MAKGRPRKYVISLTDDEVKKLKSILRKKTSCRTVRCRCQILLDLDIAHGKSLTHQQCAKSNGVSTSTVMHALTLYTAEGLDATVTLKRNINSDNSRRKVDGRAEARLIELACGPAPHGHARWTMRLLAEQSKVEVPVSKDTVCRVLKKRIKTASQ